MALDKPEIANLYRKRTGWYDLTANLYYILVTYTVCILWDLAFPQFTMVAIWKTLLPGFQGITWGSYLLGLAEIRA